MIKQFYLLTLLLFFVSITSSIVFAQNGLILSDKKNPVSDLQKQVDVLHYDLKFDLNTDDKLLSGDATITAVNSLSKSLDIASNQDIILEPEPTSSAGKLELNLYDNLEILSLTVNNQIADYSRKKNRILIKPNEQLVDTFTIEIKYKGTPQRSGFDGFVFGNVNGQSLVYNISEPIYASTWFPCDDDPADKALLDVEITNDSQFVSVSNGLLVSETNNGNKKTYHYKTVYPISTYLVAVYSAPYKTFNDVYISLDGKDTMQVNYFAMPEHFEDAKIDFADHVDYLQTLSKIFGEYPFIKEKYGVAEFLWNFGAMENQTITGIGYAFVSGNDFFRDTYVHELAHQWWGNSVGPKTWNDIWLNEGFATYSEALYAEAKHGKDALISKMQSKFSDYFRGTLYAPKDLFGETVYDKGAWVLHMLRYEIGDSAFFKSLHEYYDLYKYSNASVEDFKNVCENVSSMNLNKFFDQWVYTGTENIFCSYTLSFKDQNKKECEINIYQNQRTYEEFHFPLDIKIDFVDSSSTIEKVYVDKRETKFNFKYDLEIAAIQFDPDSKLLGTFEKSYSR